MEASADVDVIDGFAHEKPLRRPGNADDDPLHHTANEIPDAARSDNQALTRGGDGDLYHDNGVVTAHDGVSRIRPVSTANMIPSICWREDRQRTLARRQPHREDS